MLMLGTDGQGETRRLGLALERGERPQMVIPRGTWFGTELAPGASHCLWGCTERESIHLPLSSEKTYTLRLTLLLGDLFPLFYNALMNFNAAQLAQPFLHFCAWANNSSS